MLLPSRDLSPFFKKKSLNRKDESYLTWMKTRRESNRNIWATGTCIKTWAKNWGRMWVSSAEERNETATEGNRPRREKVMSKRRSRD